MISRLPMVLRPTLASGLTILAATVGAIRNSSPTLRVDENVQIEGGNLVITARQEKYTGADGIARNYTSTRLKTQSLFSQAYGRFEARIRIPTGQGIWPAFWMLGSNLSTVDWPKCGEIDIMENIGREPGTVHGSLHGPSSVAFTSDLTASTSLPSGQKLFRGFSRLCGGVGAWYCKVFCGFESLRDIYPVPVAGKRAMGFRSSVFHYFECRGRR